MTNPYPPNTKAHAVAQIILEAHAAGQWVTTDDLVQRTGAIKQRVAEIRYCLRERGLVRAKRAYARCAVCGEPSVARGLCNPHYQRALAQVRKGTPKC